MRDTDTPLPPLPAGFEPRLRSPAHAAWRGDRFQDTHVDDAGRERAPAISPLRREVRARFGARGQRRTRAESAFAFRAVPAGSRTKLRLRPAPAGLVRPPRPPRPALAASAHALPRVAVGNHAAADAGQDGDAVLRALRRRVARRCPTLAAAPLRRSAGAVVRARLLRPRPQPARGRAALRRAARRRPATRLRCADRPARHRPQHRRRRSWRRPGASASRSSTATSSACWRATTASTAGRASRGRKAAVGSWRCTRAHLPPTARMADYTQAQMDLGATLCTRSNPACVLCPLQARLHRAQRRPRRRTAHAAPGQGAAANARALVLLARERRGRRPAAATSADRHLGIAVVVAASRRRMSRRADWFARASARRLRPAPRRWPKSTHAFSHYRLHTASAALARRSSPRDARRATMTTCAGCARDELATLGIPAPIRKLLEAAPLIPTHRTDMPRTVFCEYEQARDRRPGFRALARRTGPARVRPHRQAGMGGVARAPDHADQREPPVAAATPSTARSSEARCRSSCSAATPKSPRATCRRRRPEPVTHLPLRLLSSRAWRGICCCPASKIKEAGSTPLPALGMTRGVYEGARTFSRMPPAHAPRHPHPPACPARPASAPPNRSGGSPGCGRGCASSRSPARAHRRSARARGRSGW